MTLIREWRGRSKPEQASAVLEHYRTRTKPLMVKTPGFIRAVAGSRDIGGLVEFMLISYWKDEDSMKAFAGHVPDKAVVSPGAEGILQDTESFVRIFEVLDEIGD